MVHSKKDQFLRGTYNKIKWKKIGPCKILRKFSANAYEIELPREVGISPNFNVSDLYLYHADESRWSTVQEGASLEVSWEEQLPRATSTILERTLDTRVSKKPRGKKYYEYLIKWKDHPMEDSTWMTTTMIHKSCVTIEDLMDRSP